MSEKLCMLYSKQSRLKAMINEAITNGAEELAERLDDQLNIVNESIDNEILCIYGRNDSIWS